MTRDGGIDRVTWRPSITAFNAKRLHSDEGSRSLYWSHWCCWRWLHVVQSACPMRCHISNVDSLPHGWACKTDVDSAASWNLAAVFRQLVYVARTMCCLNVKISTALVRPTYSAIVVFGKNAATGITFNFTNYWCITFNICSELTLIELHKLIMDVGSAEN